MFLSLVARVSSLVLRPTFGGQVEPPERCALTNEVQRFGESTHPAKYSICAPCHGAQILYFAGLVTTVVHVATVVAD